MIYAASITIAANTTKVDAVRTPLTVTKGLVWRIEVEFPPGCHGLAHIQIFDGSYQIAPATPGTTFHSDGVIMGYDDLYFKDVAPFSLDIITWNLDTIYEHTVQVRVCLASSQAFMARYMPSLTWEKMNETLALITADQDRIKAAQLEALTQQLEDI